MKCELKYVKYDLSNGLGKLVKKYKWFTLCGVFIVIGIGINLSSVYLYTIPLNVIVGIVFIILSFWLSYIKAKKHCNDR